MVRRITRRIVTILLLTLQTIRREGGDESEPLSPAALHWRMKHYSRIVRDTRVIVYIIRVHYTIFHVIHGATRRLFRSETGAARIKYVPRRASSSVKSNTRTPHACTRDRQNGYVWFAGTSFRRYPHSLPFLVDNQFT